MSSSQPEAGVGGFIPSDTSFNVSPVRIVKPCDKLPDREALLARIDETISRLGRIAKDLKEIRAEVLTTKS